MSEINKTFKKFDDEIENTISENKKMLKKGVEDSFSY